MEAAKGRPVLAVFLIAMAVRVMAAAVIYAVEGGTLFLDDESYSRIAAEAASGAGERWDAYIEWVYERTFTLLGPIAGLYEVTGEFTLAGQLWVALAGAVVAALTTWLALRFLPRGWAIVAGLVVALLPSQLLWSSLILKDPIVAACMCGLAVCVYRANVAENGRRAVISLLPVIPIFVALAYTRQQSLIVAVWCVVAALLFGRWRPTATRVAAALVLALAVPAVVTEYGLGGNEARSGFAALEEQRGAAAVGAETAVVAPDPRGVEPEEPAPQGDKKPEPEAEPEPEPAPEPEPDEGNSIGDNISYLPTGIQAYLLRPYPWEVDTSAFDLRVASFENLAWYCLFALALVGLTGAWRVREVLAFPVFILGGTIILYSLSEGNLGTAFRHRSEILWPVALLATLGAKLIADRFFIRERASSADDRVADSGNGRLGSRRALERA